MCRRMWWNHNNRVLPSKLMSVDSVHYGSRDNASEEKEKIWKEETAKGPQKSELGELAQRRKLNIR